jgi:hypothetical protein
MLHSQQRRFCVAFPGAHFLPLSGFNVPDPGVTRRLTDYLIEVQAEMVGR